MRARVVLPIETVGVQAARNEINRNWRAPCTSDKYLFALWRAVLEEDEIIIETPAKDRIISIIYSKGVGKEDNKYFCYINFRPIGTVLQRDLQLEKRGDLYFSTGNLEFNIKLLNDFSKNHYKPARFSAFNYEIKPVSTHGEMAEFSRIMKCHKMGTSRYSVAIVAKQRDKICGAASLDVDRDLVLNSTAWDKFRIDLSFLRRYVLYIRRMVAIRGVGNFWLIYRSMFRNIGLMCGAFSTESILVIGGHTHDPNPAAASEGFFFEVPRNPKLALFYWKPIKGIASPEIAESVSDRKRKLKKYLAAKRAVSQLSQ